MPTFQSEGLTLAYMDERPQEPDRGEAVLLVHGFASNHVVNWVNPQWVRCLTSAGYRVVAFDNRGHGASDKPHLPADYHPERMAADALNLLDKLGLRRAALMGYSMGARIATFATLAAPDRVAALVLGGLGNHLVDKDGLPTTIADAMTAPSLDDVKDPMGRLFRRFAEANGSDLRALAACIVGSRQTVSPDDIAGIITPTLVAVGSKDDIAGDPHRLAAFFPQGRALEIPGRDHNLAVGDRVFKAGVLEFLDAVSAAPVETAAPMS